MEPEEGLGFISQSESQMTRTRRRVHDDFLPSVRDIYVPKYDTVHCLLDASGSYLPHEGRIEKTSRLRVEGKFDLAPQIGKKSVELEHMGDPIDAGDVASKQEVPICVSNSYRTRRPHF
ncbi:hypothetical protein MPTK1_1g19090 [Marchantia polymorpha subsp. ruderalis]|uniref:Uncharacterized protein n=2 Tax=Marchantia polymorpha TaxID=3197 RepID=A0AAF6ARS1_MARPO|nr:hypothetical protein MARPO_0001s0247 [Marchantia polymorpha]BBM99141.1 hypothetical protein Mp_1g19090 [Marchantia polymorpha subsp. ruderalis]|eukprot:PTQ50218.1 hypothetical protein MARPO_0001s0247 [Marchantia polymorpha]